ncbi:hypothetical protein PMW_100 [Pseudomonas phage phiPMW]|uniref:Uncharacterized protein n=1 Tax=Pseudomonas phage phiPMW TaxID=1815582 RepID=A0A1S5R1D6_9CAUD|nr:hypothetical protein FDG97_gp100 [Pseudomonas phage phiPMW]ANA49225.1 hypothetical protein PMW_100 [Pseudomonas phage phiPMW]
MVTRNKPPAVGYWMAFVEDVKALLQRPLSKDEYRDMMMAYIKGVKAHTYVEGLK